MGRPRKTVLAVCPACGGDNLRLDSEGCMEVHNERVVTPLGVSSGMFLCAGSGERPEPVDEPVDDAPMPVGPMDAERWPTPRELVAERFDLPKKKTSRRNEK